MFERKPRATTLETLMTQRLTHCPETGKSLDGVNIRKHVQTLWPHLDATDSRFEEARRRKAKLLAEAELREAEAERKK